MKITKIQLQLMIQKLARIILKGNVINLGATRKLIEQINQKLLKGLDCSEYLFKFDLPNNIYKKIVSDKNTNVNINRGGGLYSTQTPLIKACEELKDILKIRLLLNNPSLKINKKDDAYQRTALSWACFSDNDNVLTVNLLLKTPEIDVNSRDSYGYTALILAVFGNKIKIIKALLNHPDIEVSIRARDKSTAFSSAKSKLIQNLIRKHPTYKGLAIKKGFVESGIKLFFNLKAKSTKFKKELTDYVIKSYNKDTAKIDYPEIGESEELTKMIEKVINKLLEV